MAHHCHATDCKTSVPPEMLMCSKHWRMVPRKLQSKVWATYREGQCDDWNPSAAYCEAAKAAVVSVANQEGKTPDVTLYDVFGRHAEPEPGKLF